MQIEPSVFLPLVEKAKKIAIMDTESFGFNGDYGTIICATIKPYGGKPTTFKIKQLGNDKAVIREARDYLEEFDAWVTFFGKGHDIPLLNTRLLRHGLDPISPRPHIDLYFTLKPKLRTASKTQAHLLRFLGTSEQKMSVSPQEWGEMGMSFTKNLRTIVSRCESDVEGLEALYNRTKHLIRDIKR